MSDKKELVFQTMNDAGKPLRPGDLAKLSGLSSKDVSQIINDLKKEGKIISPKRCFYAPAKR